MSLLKLVSAAGAVKDFCGTKLSAIFGFPLVPRETLIC